MIEPEKNEQNPKLYSPLVLAYMGDAVFEVMVREKMVLKANMQVGKLHKHTVAYVCATAQSRAIELLMDHLTEEEISIYKRGRNAHSAHSPKNADIQEYRRATGFEALFGYLYLSGESQRVRELFQIVWENFEQSL